jgi:hypothetical protein
VQGDGHEQYFEWSLGPVNMKTKDEVQFATEDRREIEKNLEGKTEGR